MKQVCFLLTFLFEFDDSRNKANLEKHGIDFEAAQEPWNDPHLLEIQARSEDQRRLLIIGRIGEKHRSAVVTYREDRTRIVSVRRSRKREEELYES